MKDTKPEYYAFFDVDGTITYRNTMKDFLRFFYQKRFFNAGLIGDVVFALHRIRTEIQISFGQNREFINKQYYKCFKNQKIKRIKEIGMEWYEKKFNVQSACLRNTLDELMKHKNEGGEIVFVSGSFDACLAPLAKELGVKHILATTLETRDEYYTGNILPPQTIGVGKLEAIEQFMDFNKFDDYESCYAYGDHISDLPMLSLVGNPRVIAGDDALEGYAKLSGWKIIY